MTAWDAEHYLRYGSERTRPAVELAARVQLSQPSRIVDFGCGPGNSTQVLRARWPEARISGLDNSAEMIDSARSAFPDQDWSLEDGSTWTSDEPLDLLFSNAVLQWIPDHETLIPRLLAMIASGGALAFQIPSNSFAAVRRHIHETADDPAWSARMDRARSALTMLAPSDYYDLLAPAAKRIDVWETEYLHVMETLESIVDWIASTGMRPFLAALDNDQERRRFREAVQTKVDASYPTQPDGNVLFPFRRLFAVAYA